MIDILEDVELDIYSSEFVPTMAYYYEAHADFMIKNPRQTLMKMKAREGSFDDGFNQIIDTCLWIVEHPPRR